MVKAAGWGNGHQGRGVIEAEMAAVCKATETPTAEGLMDCLGHERGPQSQVEEQAEGRCREQQRTLDPPGSELGREGERQEPRGLRATGSLFVRGRGQGGFLRLRRVPAGREQRSRPWHCGGWASPQAWASLRLAAALGLAACAVELPLLLNVLYGHLAA